MMDGLGAHSQRGLEPRRRRPLWHRLRTRNEKSSMPARAVFLPARPAVQHDWSLPVSAVVVAVKGPADERQRPRGVSTGPACLDTTPYSVADIERTWNPH